MTVSLSKPVYSTNYGEAYLGDALYLLESLDKDSIDLVFTSPPFPLQRPKKYGNEDQDSYVDWLLKFAPGIKKVLKNTGSLVLDIGGAYQKGRPIRSLHNYKILIGLCEQFEFRLAEEFFWYNPCKLPSPIEWVNKRKIRAKDSVNTIWWLSKTDNPKADVTKVLVPYSKRMKKLHENPEKYYKPKERPSGHDIGKNFATDNGGAIPSNLLQIPNTESNSRYIQLCKAVGISAHPARFPQKLPAFFINFLTAPGDTVLDIFAGSNTTGIAAETLNRRWIAFDQNSSYLAASAFRFMDNNESIEAASTLYEKLLTMQETINVTRSIQLNIGI